MSSRLAFWVVLFAARPASAYVVARTDQGVPLRWGVTCITFHVNDATSADVPTDKAIDAVKKSFQAWEDVPDAYVRFLYGGITNVTAAGMDKDPHNVVVWREDASEWTTATPDVIAQTVVTYDVETGVIADADIELNGASFEFTTEETENVVYDIRNAVTHEVGHLLGLDHSPALGATMNGRALQGEVLKRDLEPDDAAGVASIYATAKDPGVCDSSNVGDWYARPGAATTTGGGCSSGSSTPMGGTAAALFLMLLWALRRRAAWLIVLLVAAPAQGFVLYHSPDDPNVPLRWFAFDVTVVFDTTPPEAIDAATAQAQIEGSYQAWGNLTCDSQASPFDFLFAGEVSGAKVGYDEDGENENLVIWVQSGWSHGGSVLALTSLTYDVVTGEIVDADLELNDEDYTYSTNGAKDTVDLRNTAVHEAGHVLGLDHSKVSLATMFDRAPLGETIKRDLHADDIAGFCALYGPGAPPKLVTGSAQQGSSGGGCTQRSSAASGGVVVFAALALLVVLRRASPARRRYH